MATSKPMGSGYCPLCGERGQYQLKTNSEGYKSLTVFHAVDRKNSHESGYRTQCYLGMWSRLQDQLKRRLVNWRIFHGAKSPFPQRFECSISAEAVEKARVRAPHVVAQPSFSKLQTEVKQLSTRVSILENTRASIPQGVTITHETTITKTTETVAVPASYLSYDSNTRASLFSELKEKLAARKNAIGEDA